MSGQDQKREVTFNVLVGVYLHSILSNPKTDPQNIEANTKLARDYASQHMQGIRQEMFQD